MSAINTFLSKLNLKKNPGGFQAPTSCVLEETCCECNSRLPVDSNWWLAKCNLSHSAVWHDTLKQHWASSDEIRGFQQKNWFLLWHHKHGTLLSTSLQSEPLNVSSSLHSNWPLSPATSGDNSEEEIWDTEEFSVSRDNRSITAQSSLPRQWVLSGICHKKTRSYSQLTKTN